METDYAPLRTVLIPDETRDEAKGGTRRMAVILTLVLAVVGIVAMVALPSSDRIDRLTSGAKGEGGEISLAQAYVAGESFEYGMTMRMKASMEGSEAVIWGDSVSGEMEMELAGLIRIDVLSVEPNGNGLVQLSFSGFSGNFIVKADGQEIKQSGSEPLQGICETSVTMTVDPFGKMIGDPETNGPGTGGFVDLNQLFGQGLDGAPRGRLRVGDSWTSRTAVPMDAKGAQKMDVEAEYEVLGHKKFKGRLCIVIGFEGSLSGKQGPGMKVDADLKGAMLIDSRNGCLVKSAMDIELSMSGSSPAGSFEADMEMSVDVDLK